MIKESQEKSENIITWLQYSNHITPQDCWTLIDGNVYDVSDYLVQHPGGDDILIKYSGLDASLPFNQQLHSAYAISLRNARKVGKIETPVYSEEYRQMLQEKKRKLKQARKGRQKKVKVFRQNIPEEELKEHNIEKSCWIAIEGKVYDVTDFMESHPGGARLISEKAGQDATASFRLAKHSMEAIQKKEQYLIGTLKKNPKKIPNLVFLTLLIVCALMGAWLITSSPNTNQKVSVT